MSHKQLVLSTYLKIKQLECHILNDFISHVFREELELEVELQNGRLLFDLFLAHFLGQRQPCHLVAHVCELQPKIPYLKIYF